LGLCEVCSCVPTSRSWGTNIEVRFRATGRETKACLAKSICEPAPTCQANSQLAHGPKIILTYLLCQLPVAATFFFLLDPAISEKTRSYLHRNICSVAIATSALMVF